MSKKTVNTAIRGNPVSDIKSNAHPEVSHLVGVLVLSFHAVLLIYEYIDQANMHIACR